MSTFGATSGISPFQVQPGVFTRSTSAAGDPGSGQPASDLATLGQGGEVEAGWLKKPPSEPSQPQVTQQPSYWGSAPPLEDLAGQLEATRKLAAEQAAEIARLRAALATSEGNLTATRIEVSQVKDERDALASIGRACSQTEDPRALVGSILDEAIHLVGAQKGSLYLYDPKTDSLSCQVFRGVPREGAEHRDSVRQSVESGQRKSLTFRPGEGVAGTVFATRQPMIVDNTGLDGRFKPSPTSFADSILCVPLVLPDGSCVGVLNMTNKQEGGQFTPADAERMKAVCGTAAMGIANAQKKEALSTDHLTGVASRAAMEQYLDEQLQSRGDKGLSVLFLDVNHFKRINDDPELGHDAGDLVLKQVAQKLKQTVGEAGIVGRFGGDEFAVIAPRMGAFMAQALGEQLQQAVGAEPVMYEGRAVKTSISFGSRSFDGSDANVDARQLFRDADRGMYRQKKQSEAAEADPGLGFLLRS